MWRSETHIEQLYRSSSFLLSAQQRDLDLQEHMIKSFYMKFKEFLIKYNLDDFIDCTSAPIIQMELFDNLSDQKIIRVLKAPMQTQKKLFGAKNINQCAALVRKAIGDKVKEMTNILTSVQAYVERSDQNSLRNSLRQYWSEDIKPKLDENTAIVAISLLLICNNEHIMKGYGEFLHILDGMDAITVDKKTMRAIIEQTKKILKNSETHS